MKLLPLSNRECELIACAIDAEITFLEDAIEDEPSVATLEEWRANIRELVETSWWVASAMAKLKVYRTPIGTYVAAPSQKAALEAWGSERNLFARGVAEIVTDPALVKEPLERPGEVIKRLRGTAAEQIAALPPDEPPRREKRSQEAEVTRRQPARRPRQSAHQLRRPIVLSLGSECELAASRGTARIGNEDP